MLNYDKYWLLKGFILPLRKPENQNKYYATIVGLEIKVLSDATPSQCHLLP